MYIHSIWTAISNITHKTQHGCLLTNLPFSTVHLKTPTPKVSWGHFRVRPFTLCTAQLSQMVQGLSLLHGSTDSTTFCVLLSASHSGPTLSQQSESLSTGVSSVWKLIYILAAPGPVSSTVSLEPLSMVHRAYQGARPFSCSFQPALGKMLPSCSSLSLHFPLC